MSSGNILLLLIPQLTFWIPNAAVIDRTAGYVARSANPPQFEEKIRETQRNDPKFSFLNPLDPYHAYYRHKLERATAGDNEEEAAPKGEGETKTEVAKEPVDMGLEPPTPEFILELPNLNGIDLYGDLVTHAFGRHSTRLLKGHHEAHCSIHRTTRSSLPSCPFREGRAQLPIRFPPTYPFPVWILQPPR